MRRTITAPALVVLLAGLAAQPVLAATRPTPVEQAELQQLSPAVRQRVEARMKDGQTVHGILETMLLNRISQDFATRRIVATDFVRGDTVVEGQDGQLHVIPFNVETLAIRPGS